MVGAQEAQEEQHHYDAILPLLLASTACASIPVVLPPVRVPFHDDCLAACALEGWRWKRKALMQSEVGELWESWISG